MHGSKAECQSKGPRQKEVREKVTNVLLLAS